MAGVQAEGEALLGGIAEVKLVGADSVGFHADAEEFAFDGVDIPLRIDLRGEDGVEGIAQAFARGEAICGDVLVTVGDPDIGDGGEPSASPMAAPILRLAMQ